MKRTVIRIGDIASIGRGSSPRPISDKKYFEDGKIPWIKIADATASGKYIYETKEYVNELGASYSRRMKPGTLILSASGVSLGIPHFLGVEGCIHDGWIYMDNIHDIDQQYLYYLLLTMRTYFDNLSYGAAIQNINTPILSRTKIEIPLVECQIKISTILSMLDDLIECNVKRIKVLEEMAENLYKEWFVRFRFPGYESYSFLSGVPEEWKLCKLENIIKIDRGLSYTSEEIEGDEGVDLINLKNIQSYGGYRYDGTKKYNGKYKQEQVVKVGDLVMGVTDMTQDRRTVGSVAMIPIINNTSVISADLIKITSDINTYFLYSMFKYGSVSRYISQFANGANVLHLRPQSINRVKVYIPTKDIIEKYSLLVQPIFEEVNVLNEKVINLIKQRDFLLPRLMSGKLEIN